MFKFAMGETKSLYGRQRQLMYIPDLEDRELTEQELKEQKEIEKQITVLMSERHDILVEFAIGKLSDSREKRAIRLNQIETELGIKLTNVK